MNMLNTLAAKSNVTDRLPPGLPVNSEMHTVAFVSEKQAGQSVLVALPNAFQQFAISIDSGLADQANPSQISKTKFEFLSVPTANHQDAGLQTIARDWVDVAALHSGAALQMMTLQGAQVFWCGERVAILAPVERLESMRATLIEVCWFETELSDLENSLSEVWPQLERDLPLAFTFNEKALSRRAELQTRFQQVMEIRMRLARLTPHVHCPHQHPPTLASQVAERFRERVRLLHRHEVLGGQLEVFEKIYENCGQRVSDFVQSRTGHILEWVIILLLLAQILIWGFEILTSLDATSVSQ